MCINRRKSKDLHIHISLGICMHEILLTEPIIDNLRDLEQKV